MAHVDLVQFLKEYLHLVNKPQFYKFSIHVNFSNDQRSYRQKLLSIYLFQFAFAL